MKFELVEPPEPAPSEGPGDGLADGPDDEAGAADEDEAAVDPIAELTATTARLTAEVEAEGEQIAVSMAELAEAMQRSGPAAPTPKSGPPANFRAGRFGASGHDSGATG